MIVVTVELYSSITYKTTTLGRMLIVNDGTGTLTTGHYQTFVGRKGQTEPMIIYSNPQRKGIVRDHRRKALSVWTLVRKALESLTY